MRVLRVFGRVLGAVLIVTGARAALAAPMTYNLVVGPNSAVTAVTVGDDQSTNRLVGGSVSLTAGQVIVDLSPSVLQLHILSLAAAGPGVVDLDGINGWDTVTFTNATLNSTDDSPLFPTSSPDTYNYGLPVQVVATLQLVGPGGTFNSPFSAPTGAGGELIAINGVQAVEITITGVTLGALPDPINPQNPPVLVKGDFHFTAVLPEPGIAALSALGLAGILVLRRNAGRS
jgi:hypothetical protein